jgi:hypothetical protein
VPFNYYHRLSRRQQAVYRKSDAITEVPVPDPERMRGAVDRIAQGLKDENLTAVQAGSELLAMLICSQLGVPRVRVKVLARRPSDDWGELHGLYEPGDPPGSARITVWMRTAKRKQVVAFKTYLRTVLHEIGHHLDYEYYRLDDSFHTEGFYKRENHLFNLLTAAGPGPEPVQQQLFTDT